MTVYMMGSGPLDNPIASGAAATAPPNGPLSQETLTATATIGNASAHVLFAGMAPMQVSVQLPAVSGNQPVQVQLGPYTQQFRAGVRGAVIRPSGNRLLTRAAPKIQCVT